MADIDSDFVRTLSGKVGGVSIVERYGKKFARLLPVIYHDAQSEEQLHQRGKLQAVIALYQQLKDTPLSLVWRTAAIGLPRSGYNLFVKRNIHAFRGDGFVRDYSQLHFSEGTLQQAENLHLASTPDSYFTLRWTCNPETASSSHTDRLIIILVEEGTTFFPHVIETPACRADELFTFRLPDGVSLPSHLYCFFSNEDFCLFSNDKYFQL